MKNSDKISIEQMIEEYAPVSTFTATTESGAKVEGYLVDDRMDAEVDGHVQYELRTKDNSNEISTMEHRVMVNFAGTLVCPIGKGDKIPQKGYLELSDILIDGTPYQTLPQVILEYEDEDSYPADEDDLAVMRELVGNEGVEVRSLRPKQGAFLHEYFEFPHGFEAFRLPCTYAEAVKVVDRLNAISDKSWCIGNCYRDYFKA